MADTPSPLSLDTGPLSTGERFKPSGWAEEGDLDPYAAAKTAHRTAAEKEEALAKRFEARRPKEEAESERAYAGAERAAAQPRPPVPQMERVGSPPKPEDYQKMSMGYLGAMVLLGAFGGKFIRNAANAPLAAFNGALKGWQEGNLEAYQQKSAEWKEKQQQVLDNNRARLDEYRTILEDRNASIQDQMLRVKLTAAKHQDKMMYDRADAENWTGVAQAYDQGVAVHEKAVAATDKIVEQQTQVNETAVERANEWKAHLATPQGQQELAQLDRRTPGAAFRIRSFVKQYADQAAAAGAASLPAELRGPVPPNMKPADMAARQFRIESYQAGKGEPSSSDWARFYRQQHPGRSGAALALQGRIEEYEDKFGRPPSGEQVTRWVAEYNFMTAAGRTAGGRLGNIEVAVQEFAKVMPLASEASKNVPRGKFVPFNKLKNDVRTLMSDPAYQEFVDANEAAITAYSSTMSRSGANSVHAQQRADRVLSTATSDAAYQRGLLQLKREVDAVESAPARALEVIQKLGMGIDPAAAPPASRPAETEGRPQGKTSTGVPWKVE